MPVCAFKILFSEELTEILLHPCSLHKYLIGVCIPSKRCSFCTAVDEVLDLTEIEYQLITNAAVFVIWNFFFLG